MSYERKGLLILGLIILTNLFITIVYRKYRKLKTSGTKDSLFQNDSIFVWAGFSSFSPSLPFLIISRPENISIKRLIFVHNILCFVVYFLFALAIFF